MATVQGVLGPIDTSELGFTLMHEHILVANWAMRQSFADWVDLEAHAVEATAEVVSAKERGVRTIVDLTPINLGRDIHAIHDVAERAGMQVIAATGLYWTEEPWMQGWETDRLVEFLVRDITDGIQGTSRAPTSRPASSRPRPITSVSPTSTRRPCRSPRGSTAPPAYPSRPTPPWPTAPGSASRTRSTRRAWTSHGS
jgi:phosphotriesterase-related protein